MSKRSVTHVIDNRALFKANTILIYLDNRYGCGGYVLIIFYFNKKFTNKASEILTKLNALNSNRLL